MSTSIKRFLYSKMTAYFPHFPAYFRIIPPAPILPERIIPLPPWWCGGTTIFLHRYHANDVMKAPWGSRDTPSLSRALPLTFLPEWTPEADNAPATSRVRPFQDFGKRGSHPKMVNNVLTFFKISNSFISTLPSALSFTSDEVVYSRPTPCRLSFP